jgi:hypothetical protein
MCYLMLHRCCVMLSLHYLMTCCCVMLPRRCVILSQRHVMLRAKGEDVQRAGNSDAGLLPPRQSDTPLTHLGAIAGWEGTHVSVQVGGLEYGTEQNFVKRPPKRNIIPQRGVRDPRLLRAVRHTARRRLDAADRGV